MSDFNEIVRVLRGVFLLPLYLVRDLWRLPLWILVWTILLGTVMAAGSIAFYIRYLAPLDLEVLVGVITYLYCSIFPRETDEAQATSGETATEYTSLEASLYTLRSYCQLCNNTEETNRAVQDICDRISNSVQTRTPHMSLDERLTDLTTLQRVVKTGDAFDKVMDIMTDIDQAHAQCYKNRSLHFSPPLHIVTAIMTFAYNGLLMPAFYYSKVGWAAIALNTVTTFALISILHAGRKNRDPLQQAYDKIMDRATAYTTLTRLHVN